MIWSGNLSTWTGTWRDPRFPGAGGQPENALIGNLYMDDQTNVALGIPLKVPSTDANTWFWANTAVAKLQAGQVASLGQYVVGYEVNEDLDNGFRPAGLIDLSSTTFTTPSHVLVPWGTTVGTGTGTHSLSLYRAASGALVFGAGTVQWDWGLGFNNWGPINEGTTEAPDLSIEQATVNLLANMGTQPATLVSGLVAATASTDHTPRPRSSPRRPLARTCRAGHRSRSPARRRTPGAGSWVGSRSRPMGGRPGTRRPAAEVGATPGLPAGHPGR